MNIGNRMLSFLPKLWANWIALLGTTMTTVSGNVILVITVVDITTGGANQYASALAYLLMPPAFIAGLMLIALGAWIDHRRVKGGAQPSGIDKAVNIVIGDKTARRRVAFVLVASIVNITVISLAAYQGLSYMNTTRFCGKLCHSVMEPEYNAYSRSPHSRVPCVDCHIGAGADWFVRSKLSGMRQVWATFTGDFSRPVPTPIKHLRPARETCERCHWPQKFHGARLMIRDQFAADKTNTRTTNVVRLNVGGVNKRTGKYEGIHWHVAPDVRIEYDALDERRGLIGQVRLSEKGKTTTFQAPDKLKGKAVVERRVMDCVDCHNRPTHIYDPTPEVAVDRALSLGKITTKLPFIRKEAVALLRSKIDKPEQAARIFSDALQAYYLKNHQEVASAQDAAIKKAGKELGWIYRRNIYPRLKLTWGTYPSHLGHRLTTEGCFRCHDDEHTAKIKGEEVSIAQDCDKCHEVLAEEEEKPDVPESLLQLGRF